MTKAWILLASTMLGGCGSGLNGAWQASGEVETTRLFRLDLTFEGDDRGMAVFTERDGVGRATPLCRLAVKEAHVRFDVDAAGSQTCATSSHPLTFQGTIGHDVVVGEVLDASGKKTGMWRAFRAAASP